QWSASTGNDAAPYFRIFNPTRQSEKFDPEGDFIRQYLPELAHLDKHTIHEPYANNQQHLFLDYPPPMVNHRQATQDTVKHFQQLKHN
ncbi:MAG TPA: FAD-binding domain-containing protein, partial [Agitococcus sp.]|nr:FAD-binding domain-containing protein [Agitococcus sp.]